MKFLPLALAFASFSAFAIEVNFSFNVNSSGPSIYPCDAGIQHAAHSGSFCYDRNTQQSCDIQACEDGEDCSCVCTSSDADNASQDFFTAGVADWADNGAPLPSSTSVTITASDLGFNRISSNKDEWNKQLTTLTFNLGSERYGTEYYLDVCYRGPQIPFNNNSADSRFAMKLQSTLSDLTSAVKYSELADLKVKMTYTCDLQGVGSDTGPATSDATAHQITGVSGGDKTSTGSFQSYTAGQTLLLVNEFINTVGSQAPRFCKIRYSFIENMRNNTQDPLATLRRWTLQQARITTFSDVSSKKELN